MFLPEPPLEQVPDSAPQRFFFFALWVEGLVWQSRGTLRGICSPPPPSNRPELTMSFFKPHILTLVIANPITSPNPVLWAWLFLPLVGSGAVIPLFLEESHSFNAGDSW